MSPLLGVVADDYTGAGDVAAALRRGGMRTVLRFGEPTTTDTVPDCDAVVVGLKTRSIDPAQAVRQSVVTRRWLAGLGASRFYFKYCSTFDSTDEGNIGPVADALADDTGSRLTLICPASPEHGRTTYMGHLFVGATLLSDSPMRHHPLTPMTDPDLVRVLGRQSPHQAGLLPLAEVRAGTDAVRSTLQRLSTDEVRHVVVDATTEDDLLTVARACGDLALITGGAGLAGALARAAVPATARGAEPVILPEGPGVVLAGSCSAATLDQLDLARQEFAAHRLDPVSTPDADQLADRALDWLDTHLDDAPVVVYSSAGPEEREVARSALGPGTAEILERTLGLVARRAVQRGVRRVVVAGGETSGAITTALGVEQVVVGDEADRGVPWLVTTGDDPIALLLKSGNFGRPDLLVRAMEGTTR